LPTPRELSTAPGRCWRIEALRAGCQPGKGKQTMKIVVLDGYTENPGDLSWGGFEAIGETVVYERTPVDKIVERIGEAEAVIINKTPISRETLDACPGIKFIGVLATGYNVVDTAAARERGIPVCNIPAYGTASVGQFAIGLLMEICHHIGAHSDSVHSGEWENNVDWCYWKYPLIELDGKTMGIIGFGRIGQTTGRIAKALGMKVIAYDSFPTDAGRALAEYVELDTLLAASDVIALHCPLFPDTQGIIDSKAISKMKDGVIILNNSRGPLIVEQDLADALNCGKVAAAGLDVVSTEPIRGDNPLLTAKNCIITPHISWAAKEPRQRIMDMAVENLQAFLDGHPINVVNQ
jgi:glycerate dehydrogenase